MTLITPQCVPGLEYKPEGFSTQNRKAVHASTLATLPSQRRINSFLTPSDRHSQTTPRTVQKENGTLFVTPCTTLHSRHVQHCTHVMYNTALTPCTTLHSRHVQHCTHPMYNTALTPCTTLHSRHVQHCTHAMYNTALTSCTTLHSRHVQHCTHNIWQKGTENH